MPGWAVGGRGGERQFVDARDVLERRVAGDVDPAWTWTLGVRLDPDVANAADLHRVLGRLPRNALDRDEIFRARRVGLKPGRGRRLGRSRRRQRPEQGGDGERNGGKHQLDARAAAQRPQLPGGRRHVAPIARGEPGDDRDQRDLGEHRPAVAAGDQLADRRELVNRAHRPGDDDDDQGRRCDHREAAHRGSFGLRRPATDAEQQRGEPAEPDTRGSEVRHLGGDGQRRRPGARGGMPGADVDRDRRQRGQRRGKQRAAADPRHPPGDQQRRAGGGERDGAPDQRTPGGRVEQRRKGRARGPPLGFREQAETHEGCPPAAGGERQVGAQLAAETRDGGHRGAEQSHEPDQKDPSGHRLEPRAGVGGRGRGRDRACRCGSDAERVSPRRRMPVNGGNHPPVDGVGPPIEPPHGNHQRELVPSGRHGGSALEGRAPGIEHANVRQRGLGPLREGQSDHRRRRGEGRAGGRIGADQSRVSPGVPRRRPGQQGDRKQQDEGAAAQQLRWSSCGFAGRARPARFLRDDPRPSPSDRNCRGTMKAALDHSPWCGHSGAVPSLKALAPIACESRRMNIDRAISISVRSCSS